MSDERPFGPYLLIRQVAVGGMAEIHLAKTHGLAGFEKYVAVKMIHPNFSQDESFIEMLIDEAKISVQLQHVNIAQAFDLGRVGDTYYITMEYVDGADLYRLLRRASEQELDMPVDVAAFIAKEMANGLDYAHRRRGTDGKPMGIVHRDVSPQNVLISHSGEVKLVDFGIAKATMKARQTAVGVIKGKYYYMSPEQAWGDPVDSRTDIFSAGVVLYEALTGQMLYLEEDLTRLLDMARKANIQSPRHLRRDIPPQLERIVMHALAKRREDRYQSAGDMAADLERFLHTYSPVFRASKVSDFFHKVIPVEPVADAAPVQERPPSTLTGRIADVELLRERTEFSDENSVIFRPSELRGADQSGPRPRAKEDSTRPIENRVPAHVSLIQDLDQIEEQTVISAPPGFAVRTQVSSDFGGFEPTMVDADDAETSEMVDDDLDEPTENLPAAVLPAARRAPGARDPRRPVHPALAAKTPIPPANPGRPSRESRKTPGKGVPAVDHGQSLISTLIGGTGDIPAPIAHGQPHAHAPMPLQAPPQTPPPGSMGGLPPAVRAAPDPFAPLPTGGPPLSFTKQLQAIELEEIPAQYKIARTRPRWALRVGLVAACVAVGVGIGVAMFAGVDEPTAVTLEIDSFPQGAKVTVDGESLADRTPVMWNHASLQGRYRLSFELDGYNPLEKTVLVTKTEEKVVVVLDRQAETVTLILSSEPPGADIVIGGKDYGHAPKRITGLPPGEATTLELSLSGYEPHRETLDWSRGKEMEKTVRLEKK